MDNTIRTLGSFKTSGFKSWSANDTVNESTFATFNLTAFATDGK